MMETLEARNVVLGAGAMGIATAYRLASRGEPVLLIEQFPIGHDRGSSHGAARIIRHSYADSVYANLMPDAFRAWREVECDAGQSFYLRTGGVSICHSHLDYVARVAHCLNALGVAHRRMTGSEWNRLNPVFNVQKHDDVVFEPDAGMILAAHAMAAQLSLAREKGGDQTRIMASAPVRRFDLDGSRPVIVTDQHRITADRLVITAGSWLTRLLPQLSLPLVPTRQHVLYFRPSDAASFQLGRFPSFIFMGDGPLEAYYGMPPVAGFGVKVARHGGPETDPDQEERAIPDEARRSLRELLVKILPTLADAPADHTETCLYTTAPGEQFLVDFLPGRTDVILASPCSGHGFKFSALVGKILAEMAVTGQVVESARPWGLN